MISVTFQMGRGLLRQVCVLGLSCMLLGAVGVLPADAQTRLLPGQTKKNAPAEAEQFVPRRLGVRFLLDNDYPPFNYLDEDRLLTGFNVDIGRAICLELRVKCEFVERSWDQLIPSLNGGEGDAILSSLKITPSALARVDFTDRYYFTPGRFVALRKSAKLEMTPEGLESREIGVLRGTAHAAYLKSFFRDSIVRQFDNEKSLKGALRKSTVDVVFGDGIGQSFWLAGTDSRGCCEFRGGPYFDPKYFGDGVAIAVRKGDAALRRELNIALKRVRDSGRYEELFLRYFPIKIY